MLILEWGNKINASILCNKSYKSVFVIETLVVLSPAPVFIQLPLIIREEMQHFYLL